MILKNIKTFSSLFPILNSRSCHNQKTLPKLTLFTKTYCPLCDEALEKLSPYMHLVDFNSVNIEEEGREKEFNKYRYEIPVFFLNNKFLCKNRIDLELFHRTIKDLALTDSKA